MKDVITATLKSRCDLRNYVLTEKHWKHLKDLQRLLEPLFQATITMSKERTPNIASSKLIYQYLFDHFESLKKASNPDFQRRRALAESDASGWKIAAATAAIRKLEKYYPGTDGKSYVIGTGMA
ncbi:unnamed protein product [Orchesella dallaii]|uniref:Uncharacterized protein n=1 Tax=Orchesella dallaii TaxID=48710 RepID=A0ABP1RLC1_9HEXA